jgi:cyclic pyranopterin phosphate synthase
VADCLVDSRGRTVRDLRVSVTDRCNLRCRYCMPAEGLAWAPRETQLEFDEIARLVAIFAGFGVRSVRLTGGEPLVRPRLHELVAQLSAIDELHEISLTTNGVLLERSVDALAAAGLSRVNVSLDALAPDRYKLITRRDDLSRVLAGLRALERHPRLAPIKVNVVAMRGFTEHDVLDFAELATRSPYVIRFLEFMPLDADEAWSEDALLSGAELRAIVESRYTLEEIPAAASSTARRFRIAGHDASGASGEIGFVSPVTESFCAACDRVRLTADGQLRTCLFDRAETDLRTPMRHGADDAELAGLIRDAVWRKSDGHTIRGGAPVDPGRSMSQIGG